MKTVYLPLKGSPICGHSLGLMGAGDLMMGREEGLYTVEIGGTKYVGSIVYGPCSLCNEERRKEMEEEAKRMSKCAII